MIPRCHYGKGITGVTRYVLGEGMGAGNDNLPPDQHSRVDWIGGTGFGFPVNDRADADLARRMMEFTALNQKSATRKCELDAVHLSLAWRPGEAPTRAQMEAAARGALASMGMGNAMALFVSHNDEGYAHVHVVASKINPDTGYAYDLKGNFLKLSRWAEQYERDFSGGVICLRREEANRFRDAVAARDPGAVLELMTEKRATFTERELTRALAKEIRGPLRRAQFAEKVLGHKEAVRLSDEPGGPTTRYSSRAVLLAERYVLRDAEALAKASRHDAGDKVRAAVLARGEFATMRAEQAAAYRHATGAGGLALIDGQAGTGKSYTMAAIRQAYEAAGHGVIGLAPTNAVAEDMRRDGFRRAATVHSELFALNNNRTSWGNRTVVMVDEAAMLDTRLMAMVASHARAAGAKLILVGDDRQLSSIERGGMFAALRQQYGAAALTEVTRQRKHDERRASSMMAEGNFHDALAMYDQKGAITWTRTQDQARRALVERWAADTAAAPGKSRFVFAYTNADVALLNANLRAVRRSRDELGPDQFLPTDDGPQTFAGGDRLVLTKTVKSLGLYNGVIGTIEEIKGTRITFTPDGKSAERRTFDAAEFPHIRHGYAGTIYKGQGRTLDQTYLYHSEHWRSAASYVALTRHREKAELFVARNTAPDVRELARQMARVDDRRAASQFHCTGESDPLRARSPREVMAEIGASFVPRADKHRDAPKRAPPEREEARQPPEQQRAKSERGKAEPPDPAAEKEERMRRFKATLERNFDKSIDRGRTR